MKSVRAVVTATLALVACVAGCAVKADADPVPVAIAIEFPSTPTAVVTDSVRIFVYEGAKDCADLVAIRGSGRPLPAAKIEQRKTPCELETDTGAGVELDRNKTYTLLVAAQVGEKDLLVGCSQQQAFGEVKALPVTLAYASNEFTLGTIEATTPGATTKCVKLSDKCNNSCTK